MTSSFEEITTELNRWIVLFIILLGVIGNLTNIFVFIRPVFNHHVCSWYFFILSINNFLYTIIVLMYRLLTDGFHIPILSNSLRLCQFISYMTTFSTSFSHYLIVLAAIDRYSASSRNAQRQKFNSFQIMPQMILITIIVCALFAINSPIITDLKATDDLGCNIRTTTIYNQFYVLIQLVLFDVIAPLLMIVFMLLTIRNRRLATDRPLAVSKCRWMEFHLTKILVLLVVAHILMNLSESIAYIMLLQPNIFQPFQFIQTIIRIPIQFSHVAPFLWYLIKGVEYRRELKKMFPILNLFSTHVQVNAEVDHAHIDHQPEIH